MFSEDKYYSEFKKVRNQFRKYNSYDLIGGALEYINTPYKDKIEMIERHPWLTLLLIKWVLLDRNYPNAKGIPVRNKDVHRLLQLTYELVDKLRMPNEYEHHSLFFRNMAFQQIVYQTDFSYSHLSRQAILFSSLDKNHYIYKSFKNKTGLEIQEYLDLSLATISRFLNSQYNFMPEGWLSSISKKYSNKMVSNFLPLLSKDINEIRNNISNKDNGKRYASEHYELTPFIDYPLIKVKNKYLLTNKNILFRHFEYFIYDTMRKINAEKFMYKFGEIFERYIEKSIIHSEVNYVTENDIKEALGNAGNQIDFIIQDNDANIFIDAKAVEMNSQGKTTHLSKILRDKTKKTILKAIKQSHDVIRKIEDSENCKIPSRKNNYLLVITFKELYLGNGSTYYEVVAKDKLDEIYADYKEYTCIPPENMYFITIDDFDIMVDMLKNKVLTLSEIIAKARENDTKSVSRKFEFRMHLNSMNIQLKIPEFLAVEKDKMFERIIQAVTK